MKKQNSKDRREMSVYSPSSWCNSVWKRVLDMTFAGVLLFALLPLLIVLAFVIKLTSKGEILFRQRRPGRTGREFQIFKFRTMVTNREHPGPVLTRAEDPRVTWIGRYLRKWKLDELPQLLNVLRGDMSFVGPRPQPTKLWAKPTIQQLAVDVLSVRPGITSYATLNFRNEEELLAPLTAEELEDVYTRAIMPAKLKMDLNYLQTATFASDTRLIFKTAARILSPREEENASLVKEHLPAIEERKYRSAAGNAD